MRRIVLATTALAVLTLAVPARAQAPADPVVAVVNGTQLHKSDIEAAFQSLPEQYRQMPLESIYDPLLDRVIDSQLLLTAADKQGLAERPRGPGPDRPRARQRAARRAGQAGDRAGHHRGEAAGRLRGDEEPAGLRVHRDACGAHPGRRRGRGEGDHQAARGRGRFREARHARSRPTPRPRPMAATSASSARRPWCPSSRRRRS